MIARIGAIPVPGPTQIMGTSDLVGSLMNPFLVPIWRKDPDNKRCYFELAWKRKRLVHLALVSRYTKYKHLYGAFSVLFDILRSQHRGGFLEDVSETDDKSAQIDFSCDSRM